MTVTGKHLRLSYLVSQWFRQCWDHIGPLLVLGVLFFLTVSCALGLLGMVSNYYRDSRIPFWPGGLLHMAGTVIGFWGCCLGWLAFHASVDRILRFEDFDWLGYLRDLRAHFGNSLRFALVLGLILAILGFNLVTYRHMLESSPVLRGIATVLTLWMLLFVGMVQVHAVPFLVHQGCPLRTAVDRAFRVALWKPFRSLFLLGLEIPAVLFIPPFCFILPGMAVMANQLSLLILLDEWEDPYEKTSEALRAGVRASWPPSYWVCRFLPRYRSCFTSSVDAGSGFWNSQRSSF